MTSIGIVVGAATIVMVIAIGRGGQMDVAEQFSNLNAGAIDISYEWEGEEESTGGFSFENFFSGIGNFFGGGFGNFGGRGGNSSSGTSGSDDSASGFSKGNRSSGNMPDGDMSSGNMPGGDMASGNMPDMSGDGENFTMPGGRNGDSEMEMPSDMEEMMERGNRGEDAENMPDESEEAFQGENEIAENETDMEEESEAETEEETSILDDRMNQENIILTEDDVEDILTFVPGVNEATISYSTRSQVEGGNLTEGQTYTVAGVKESYAEISNLVMQEGEFITEQDDSQKSRVCVLGITAAKELFGSAAEAYESTIYVDDRAYTVVGVLASTGMVSAGITPDETIFIPYRTGIKYITGENISPTITVISEDVNAIQAVKDSLDLVLAETYSNAEFTYSDAGSKMEAAESSNEILTMLLSAMAVIVFIVGGIGIMNVLFVSVKERTGEIGILKSLGASKTIILCEILIESAAISLLGGILGVGLSFAITPVVEYYGIRVEANLFAWGAALGFAVLTGTLFGIYPAWKASKLVPVEALNAE